MTRKRKVNQEQVQPVQYDEQFKSDYLQYGMYVIKSRAIPAVEDGLKPVQRRILWTMYEDKLTSNHGTKKSAKIVGDVMGKYHPHGDSSIYQALVDMTQPWRNFMPPAFGETNFGNMLGDHAAAMRYTETKLSKFGDLFVQNLKPGVVPFKRNFSEDAIEPELLPIKLPYLLIAGADGIAVGMKTRIPPHNPVEAINATIAYLKNNKISVDEIMKIMPGPDFPTHGTIMNKQDIKTFYETGTARLTICGHIRNGRKNELIIDEIPYTLSGNVDSGLYMPLVDSVKTDKKFPGAVNVNSYSNRNLEISVTARPGTDMEKLKQDLYAKSKVQDTMRCDFLAIVDGAPKLLTLKEYFAEYQRYQNQLIINTEKMNIASANKRLTIVNGLLVALPEIDVIIDLVRHAPNATAMKQCLTKGKTSKIKWNLKKHAKEAKTFSFTAEQAEAILQTPLRRLSQLDEKALTTEKKQLERTIKQSQALIDSDVKRRNYLIKELENILPLFKGLKRYTKLSGKAKMQAAKHNIKVVTDYVALDRFGYLHKLNKKTEVPQTIYQQDIKSNDTINFFTNNGNCYQLKLTDVPLQTPKDKGISMAGLAKLSPNEHGLIGPSGRIVLGSELKDATIIQISSDGLGKLVAGKEFISSRHKTKATKFKTKQSELMFASPVDLDQTKYLVLVSKQGLVKRLKLADLHTMGKLTNGNQISVPPEGDTLVSAYLINDLEQTITINGKDYQAKQIPLSKVNHTMKQLA